MLELLFQFPDVLRLKVTNQTNRCLSTLRIRFNLQGPPASIGVSSWVNATAVPTQFIESTSFRVQEIAEVSEILTVQKNDGALITSSAEATQ